MKTRHGVIRHSTVMGTAALLALAIAFTAGCAGTGGGAQNASADQKSSEDGQQARCRAAIADVTRLCGAENTTSGQCADAKARSRATCI